MRAIVILWICFYLSEDSVIGQTHWNHLRNETSPYLRQHAHNPVDWYPWNPVALDKAKKENKLLTISIGYASCHWCHVMESESFSDTAVSRAMNEAYISIKVDREERPDIDQIYMAACQLVNPNGCGWPLNIIALPDGQPVFIGTYMKPAQWIELIHHFANQYLEQPDKMKRYAQDLSKGISTNTFRVNDQVAIQDTFLHEQVKSIISLLDDRYGGLKGAQKFPLPILFDFLLSYGTRYHQDEVIRSVYTMLDHMMTGGIHDLLEGGFGRYTVDDAWSVPHFEKMLYDNAQLISLYAHAYQLSKNERYKKVFISIIDFLNHHLKSPSGAYYSSLDADAAESSDNTLENPLMLEGKYYVWTKDEISEALIDPILIEKCNRWFNILDEGNALSDQQHHMLGKNVLSFERKKNLEVYPPDYTEQDFMLIKSKLLRARLKRTRPSRDEKIICAWNALATSGLADAYMATADERYKAQALETGLFIWKKMRSKNQLIRIYQKNNINTIAFLEDYAQTGMAFIKLYHITLDERWLNRAGWIKERALSLFANDTLPLLYFTAHDQPALISKRFETVDQEIPSSNATMARLIMILGDYSSDQKDKDRAASMIKSIVPALGVESPQHLYYWLENALLLQNAPYEIAIVGSQYKDLHTQMMTHFIPNALWCGGKHEGRVSLLKNKLQRGKTTIYICKNNLCLLPVHETDQALKLIHNR